MTITPDAPIEPDRAPDAEPTVEPIGPDDPHDVPEVPLEPTPAPDETGIR